MTSKLANLDLAATYQDTDTIATTSGTSLNIFNIGISNLSARNHTFALKNVMHVPKLSHHLLSIYQLCKDNNCRFIYDNISFWV